tara:strand:- start:6905 stop:7129 length:225 start_codon:yes stop_codon:yes gene_type:complete
MDYLRFLKSNKLKEDNRWIVKYNKKGLVREVKLIYKPSEYYALNKHRGENARSLHNQNVLVQILEKNKQLKNNG